MSADGEKNGKFFRLLPGGWSWSAVEADDGIISLKDERPVDGGEGQIEKGNECRSMWTNRG